MLNKFISALAILLPSGITCFLLRLCGHKIGKNSKFPVFSYIKAEKMIIGNDVEFRSFVYLNVRNLTVGNNTLVSFGTQIKGNKDFTTGDNCFIGPHSLIHCEEDVKFGFYSGIGPRCTIYTHGSFLPVSKGFPAKFQSVVIEDYVWIAMSVTILPGAHIESNCVINAGVMVSSRIKSNSLIQVNPAGYTKLDLDRLMKFTRKDNVFYHRAILTNFLESRNMKFTHDAAAHKFTVNNNFDFAYFPDNNKLSLSVKGKPAINYDLENYYTDFSEEKLHQAFLFYLRRRYGLILRCRY